MECLGNTAEQRAQYRRDYIASKKEAERAGVPFDVDSFNTRWLAGLASPKHKYTKRPKEGADDLPKQEAGTEAGKEREAEKGSKEEKTEAGAQVLGVVEFFDLLAISEAVNDVVVDFLASHNIQEPRKLSQSLFTALCIDIGAQVFRNGKLLKKEGDNYNSYDIHKLTQVLGVYRRVAQECDKVATKYAFCDFCGINQWYLYNSRSDIVTPERSQLVQKLFELADSSYKSSLLDKNMSTPLGVMASVNNDIYNVRSEKNDAVPIVSASTLKMLE